MAPSPRSLPASLGPISVRSARYLEQIADSERSLVERERLQRQIANDILAATIAIKRARAERRRLTRDEHCLVADAERHVRNGAPPPARFAPLRRADHRSRRTMLSLADPGSGHLRVTLQNADLLDGVIIHQEVISRSADSRHTSLGVSAYRMIDIRQNGIIRLHAADDVPVSIYCGRPACQVPIWLESRATAWTFRRMYTADCISPCHLAAAVASAAFANGVADVKFNVGGLTATQAIDFMKRVRRSVDRDEQQTLSTQFSLCVSISDDRHKTGTPKRVRHPAGIAALSIEITAAGGWDRVTLDSAGKEAPSVPVVHRLGVDVLTRWVRDAHAVGLETYISGGMTADHIPLAVQAGVDGIGMGHWIHAAGPRRGAPGGLDPKKIREAIRVRNEAEGTCVVDQRGRSHFMLKPARFERPRSR